MSALKSSSLPAKPPVLVAGSASTQNPTNISASNATSRASPPSDLGSSSPEDGKSEEAHTTRDEPPPLPLEEPPPLPTEVPPGATDDDGWEPVWDETAQAFYFFNKLTNATQWENPRVPQPQKETMPSVADTGSPGLPLEIPPKKPVAGGYDPAIHGDYDPTADYAKAHDDSQHDANVESASTIDSAAAYAATGAFNRFTGKWQSADINPENYNDENKSKRQMNAFFDVDAAANTHDGRSLRAERSGKKLSKQELKAFREKRKERKEEKKRAWLRD